MLSLPDWAGDSALCAVRCAHDQDPRPRTQDVPGMTRDGDRLLVADEACALLRVSLRMLFKLAANRVIPAPSKLGKIRLWWESELVNAVRAARVMGRVIGSEKEQDSPQRAQRPQRKAQSRVGRGSR